MAFYRELGFGASIFVFLYFWTENTKVTTDMKYLSRWWPPSRPTPSFIVAPSLYRHSHVSLSRHLAVRTTPLFDSPGCGIKDASHSLAFSYSAPLAQWSWETALRSRHEAHLARFGHGHCFILIRSRPCALPLGNEVSREGMLARAHGVV